MGSFKETVSTGNRRASLEALRDLLADRIPGEGGANLAALSLRLMSVMTELENLPREEVNKLDDLAQRRAKRTGMGSRESGASDLGESPQSVKRRQGGRRTGRDHGSEA